jgi:hypothetical protein
LARVAANEVGEREVKLRGLQPLDVVAVVDDS